MLIRVGIVDDAPVFRNSLRAVLEKKEGFEIVAEAGDGRSAVDLVDQHLPDLVVMDLSMPVMNGLDATRAIVSKHPHVRVVILTMHADPPAKDAIHAGACALISKSSSASEIFLSILNCIRAVQTV